MEAERGPVWKDVESAARDLQDRYSCWVSWTGRPERHNESTYPKTSVMVVLKSWTIPGQKAWRQEITARWPTVAHRTMPGLLLGMMHQAEEAILERQEKGELELPAAGIIS